MQRAVNLAVAVMIMAVSAKAAEAGVLGKIVSAAGSEVVSLAISAVLVLLAGASGALFVRVVRTFREAGEFLSALGYALDDRRITREELAEIVRQGRDVFAVWK